MCTLLYPVLSQRETAGENDHTESIAGIPLEKQERTKEEERKILLQRPQFVVLAFDGSRSISMWQKTRAFAREMLLTGNPIHFTYFINAVYLLDPNHHNMFKAPGQRRGVSNIGFGTSKEDVLGRIGEINSALEEGHEIGSHNAGHFLGSSWGYDDWKGQLNLFDSIVFDIQKLNSEYFLHLKKGDIIGFRAPELGVNQEMYKALKDMGYTYDTSRVAFGHEWPKKDELGLWQFPLPTMKIEDVRSHKNKYTVGMDYSLYVLQTHARDLVKQGSPEWNELYRVTLDAYKKYFYKNYVSNHSPVFMANHFSTWNDGVYWEVMKSFAQEVCVLKDVKCVSFKELALYMEQLTL